MGLQSSGTMLRQAENKMASISYAQVVSGTCGSIVGSIVASIVGDVVSARGVEVYGFAVS